MTAPLLRVEGLTIGFPGLAGPVVEEVGLELGRGERVGLVGESGCGKTMTALAIAGLLPDRAQARGRIVLGDEDLLAMDDAALCRIRGRRIAMVFQEPMTALNPVRTIGRQVAEGPRLQLGLSRADAEARARRLLDRVGLPAPRFSPRLYPHQLSGGQRQRVVLAIALSSEPDLLIADEPTTALDVTIQAQILDLIDEVVAEHHMALLMISHDLGVIAGTTDRVLVMYAGRVVEHGPTSAVFAHRAHPYTAGLFRARPQADAGARLATIPGRVPEPVDRPPGCPFAPRCPRVTEVCRDRMPPDFRIADHHAAACFHPYAPGES